jgi:uncharacterized RDD family membrane protein YckC
MKIAPVGKRAAAFAIDIFIIVGLISLLIMSINWIFQIPVEYASVSEGYGLQVKMTDYVRENFLKIVVIYSLAKLAVVVSYFAGFESSRRQATIGKRIFGISVGKPDGSRISFKNALLRVFGKSLSGQILAIGYLMAFWTEKNRALHDFIAGTLVFESNKLK